MLIAGEAGREKFARVFYFGLSGRRVGGVMVTLPNDGEWQAALLVYEADINGYPSGLRCQENWPLMTSGLDDSLLGALVGSRAMIPYPPLTHLWKHAFLLTRCYVQTPVAMLSDETRNTLKHVTTNAVRGVDQECYFRNPVHRISY